jgi:myo-inositol 2-dehydrogenase/D-chiro-inositol 1-dehydrogenase
MRFAVLGTGRMGGLRAALLARHGEVVVAGGEPERARAVAERCGARAATVEAALASGPDAVVVASATARHAEHLDACARLGVPVLCEKPLALTLEETEAAAAQLARAGVTVQVGFQRRFDAGFRAARDAVAAGRLGTVYSIRITARDATPSPEHFIPESGGTFRDMHIHDFDLARWISGREVATVYATGTVRKHERYARHGDVDTTAIVLTMDDGTPVTVDGTRHDPRGQDVRMEVVGSDDVVAAGLGDRTPLRVLDPSGLTPRGRGWESAYERFADAFAAETDAFVALARNGGESPCPPATALEALRVAVACERSRAEGRPIALR